MRFVDTKLARPRHRCRAPVAVRVPVGDVGEVELPGHQLDQVVEGALLGAEAGLVALVEEQVRLPGERGGRHLKACMGGDGTLAKLKTTDLAFKTTRMEYNEYPNE